MENILKKISRALVNETISEEIKDIEYPVVIVDLNGRIVEVSNKLLKLFNFEKQELIDKWYPKVFHIYDEDNNKLNSIEFPITKAVLSGKKFNTKLLYSKGDGSKMKVLVGAEPITLDERPLGIVEILERVE